MESTICIDVISLLVILPASPDPRSNGIQCFSGLVDLCRFLPGVAYTSGDSGADHYKLMHKGRYFPESILLQNQCLLKQIRIVVLPDHIDGLGCNIYDYLRCEGGDAIRYINLVLAPLYGFADESVRPMITMYDERDSFVYFNDLFAPPGLCVRDVYQEPSYEYLFGSKSHGREAGDIDQECSTGDFLLYAGKGHFAVDSSTSSEICLIRKHLEARGVGCTLITRTWPVSKDHYVDLMSSSFGLLILDPFTNVIRDALMLGLPVFSATNGIGYNVFGVANDATSFFSLSRQRHKIKAHAWDRHFSRSRFNLIKQSLFFETIRMLLNGKSNLTDQIVIPFSPALKQASTEFAQELQRSCVVGSLSTATHAVENASEAVAILENSAATSVATEYRKIASGYFGDI